MLVEVDDVSRFPNRAHFGSWAGATPTDASSGDHVRHRLSCGGNRQINRVLHTMATVQPRHATEGRAYFDHKKAAARPLGSHALPQRRICDVVFKAMLDDLVTASKTGRRTTGKRL